ncbi:MAG TPA: hypothetical protein VMH61_01055 [Candidatus Acidoferrales bacterium]|nr:hypothetical protein [Candidatus Acidoferrales bacterium]
MSRRKFVAMVAAGSAALMAKPAEAAAAAIAPRKGRAVVTEAMSPADRKEYLRQKQSTLDTLKAIRKHAVPEGTELALVFHPLRPRRREG